MIGDASNFDCKAGGNTGVEKGKRREDGVVACAPAGEAEPTGPGEQFGDAAAELVRDIICKHLKSQKKNKKKKIKRKMSTKTKQTLKNKSIATKKGKQRESMQSKNERMLTAGSSSAPASGHPNGNNHCQRCFQKV